MAAALQLEDNSFKQNLQQNNTQSRQTVILRGLSSHKLVENFNTNYNFISYDSDNSAAEIISRNPEFAHLI